jgi:signal transduction histidine kinase
MIDPVSAARTSVLEQMREGMFVLDREESNPRRESHGGRDPGDPGASLRGRSLAGLLPLDPGLQEGFDDRERTRWRSSWEPDSPRVYDVNRTPAERPERRRDRTAAAAARHHRAHAGAGPDLEQQEVVATLRERERLARELHDGIGQTFGYVGLQAQAALQWVRNGNMEKAESISGTACGCGSTRLTPTSASRSLVSRPTRCKGGRSLRRSRVTSRSTRRTTAFARALDLGRCRVKRPSSPAAGVHLLRVVQEALSNSRRHGGATSLEVKVGMNRGRANITITDDGHGFDNSRLGDAGTATLGSRSCGNACNRSAAPWKSTRSRAPARC